MKWSSIVLGLFLLFLVTSSPVSAQDETTIPTPVAYSLPYPGILPGNPLYFLKAVRDNVLSFFSSGPLKKAKFDLLQADKNIEAGVLLLAQKKEHALVLTTVTRAEDYFADAISKTEDAKKQGSDTQEMIKQLTLANLKHQEILLEMHHAAKGNDKEAFARELERVKQFRKSIERLQQK
ncbi:MAG TPA: DUF5667 domain-containing protein [Methylomirabilota bacterium]|nr:DUF5667 domain-containing protein [Methylomirabilota bacterium]